MRWILLAAVLVAAAILGVGLFAPAGRTPVEAPFASDAPPQPLHTSMAPSYGAPPTESRMDAPRFAAAATRNAADIDTLAFAPFKRPETGWRTYAPHIAVEIGSGLSLIHI